MAALVEKINLIKSDPVNNNNKFWTGELYDDDTVICRWGRVGDDGQNKTFSGAGRDFLYKKVNEKKRAGRNGEIAYRAVEIVGDSPAKSGNKIANVGGVKLESVATKQIQTGGNPEALNLIRYLVKVNAHQISTMTGGQITYNYDSGLFQTPMGLVSQDNIDEARNRLTSISDFVVNRDYNDTLMEYTRDYLMLVPQDIGRKRLELNVFWSDLSVVQKQNAILDGLQASLDSSSQKSSTTISGEPEKSIFDVTLNLVNDNSIINKLHKMYYDSRKNHSCSYLKPANVYEIKIGGMEAAWSKDGAKMENIWNLWHGSSCQNLLSIMSKGFIIPPRTSSNVTGRMFSDGIYASNISTKALGYSTGYWKKTDENRYFMFIIDMAMGRFFVPSGPSSDLPKAGYDSTFAKPGISGIQNEEMIVYRTSQVNPKYLIEFK